MKKLLFMLVTVLGLVGCSDSKSNLTILGGGKVVYSTTFKQYYVMIDDIPFAIKEIQVPNKASVRFSPVEPQKPIEDIWVTVFKDDDGEIMAVKGHASREMIEDMFALSFIELAVVLQFLLITVLFFVIKERVIK